jgi:hypothetical protein
MAASTEPRIVSWLERGVLLLLVLYLCVHTLPRAWSKLNTDFPNYYLSARLAREGYDTSRMYEWAWLQREKDHRAVDIRIIGLLPITPFSTLAMWPLAALSPLAAKRVWIAVNLTLLVPLAWLLRALTGLNWQRVALLFALSFPLHRNLMYGQFYILLLLLIAGACWAYLRERYVLAGVLVALAAACKLFPALFFVVFLRRRAWRALAGGAIAGTACAAASIAVFGWNVHLTYLNEILPWTLRGEGLPPYATASASISSVLHYLFLDEPQWNPRPWHASPLTYALLLPTLQMAALAPAILLIRREDRSRERILLEWSALITAALAISTIPASYNFFLLALPVSVLIARLLEEKNYAWLGLLMIGYINIGLPMPSPAHYVGPGILLYVPRLFLTLAALMGIYALLWRSNSAQRRSRQWSQFAWAAMLAIFVAVSVFSTFRRERAARIEYEYRLSSASHDFIEAEPHSFAGDLRYIEFSPQGYRLANMDGSMPPADPAGSDDLSFTFGPGQKWLELASYPSSRIVETQDSTHPIVDNGRDPTLSVDGQTLAFLRDDHGRGRLMARATLYSNVRETPLTSPAFNVYEASFRSPGEFAVSAVESGHPPTIYLTDAAHSNAPLALGESRYPALSPDGRWMAFSRLQQGAWNLWLRDQQSGATQRIADVPCNQIQPSWEQDSKTVLYSTDCGRSLWFTAVARRRVVP